MLGRIAQTVTATGRRYDMLVAFHFIVLNGQIVRMHPYEDSYLVAKSVGVLD